MFVKTTKRHFDIFKKEGQKWISRLGLNDWRIEFFHGADQNQRPPQEARAFCNWKMENRCGGIHLAEGWPENELTDLAVKRSAFHEVLHLMLARIHCLSQMRFLDCTATIDEEIHTIIRRLETGMFEYEYKKSRKRE